MNYVPKSGAALALQLIGSIVCGFGIIASFANAADNPSAVAGYAAEAISGLALVGVGAIIDRLHKIEFHLRKLEDTPSAQHRLVTRWDF